MRVSKKIAVYGLMVAALGVGAPLYAAGEKPENVESPGANLAVPPPNAAQNGTQPVPDEKFASFTASVIRYLRQELGTKNTLSAQDADGKSVKVPFDLKIIGVDKGYAATPEADIYTTLAHFKLIDRKGKKNALHV